MGMTYIQFKEKASSLKTVMSVKGASYTVVDVFNDRMRFRRESTKSTFIIDLPELFKTFCELYLSGTPITTKTLEPAMDTAKSAALGLLIATGLVERNPQKVRNVKSKKKINNTACHE